MASSTAVFHPIVSALVEAKEVLGGQRKWEPINGAQSLFLGHYFKTGDLARVPEIESWASLSYEELNRILRDHGFTIKLSPFNPPNFGTVSILDLLVDWLVPGTRLDLRAANNQTYPGARMTDGVLFHRVSGYPHPVAEIVTDLDGGFAYMTVATRPLSGFELMATVLALRADLEPDSEYGALCFPCVTLDQEVDIGWLVRMATADKNGRPWRVAQALQQTKLALNEKGAHVKSAVAIQMRSMGLPVPKPDLVIDRPFYFWIERKGLSYPLLAGYLDYEDWRRVELDAI